jgi:SAM-dependent methyltransferase
MSSQKEIWDDLVGDAWVRNDAIIEEHGRPFGEAAMDRLGPLEGRSVLDVGCGTGGTSLELARRGAHPVLGVDLSERMLAVANQRSVDGVTFKAADVMTIDGRFDAVFSRFGVMFFDDPVAAFAHLRRLTAPGGSLAFACWRDPLSNPWMSLAVMASVPVLGPPRLPGPTEPGPFSLADPARVHQVLTDAGWAEVTVEELTREAPHPAGSAEATAAVVVEQAPPLAMALAEHPDRAADVVHLVAEAFRPLERNGAVVVGGSVNVVSATVPA